MTAPELEPGPLAPVQFERDGDRWTLIFVRDLRHSPEQVWVALTDPSRLEQWSPFNADRDLARVGPATLTMVNGDERHDMPAFIISADPPNLLEYTWGPDLLQWRLEPLGAGTRVTLRHTVTDPEMGPKVAAGWHLCLLVADRLLDGAPIGRIVGEDAMDHGWPELHAGYAAMLGVEDGARPNRERGAAHGAARPGLDAGGSRPV